MKLPTSFPKAFSSYLTDSSIKHILRDWSATEVGIRHPHGPVGLVCRDQGQVDIYSGRTRAILSISGKFLNLARNYTVISEVINLVAKDITGIFIQSKTFNPVIHNGKKVATAKVESLSEYGVIGPRTRWDERTQTFIDPVPLSDIFDLDPIFEVPKNIAPDQETELFHVVNNWLGVKVGKR